MTKKKSRPASLLDEIDIKILHCLYHEKESSVLELCSKVGVSHHRLKAHLEKLVSMGWLKIEAGKGRKLIIKYDGPLTKEVIIGKMILDIIKTGKIVTNKIKSKADVSKRSATPS